MAHEYPMPLTCKPEKGSETNFIRKSGICGCLRAWESRGRCIKAVAPVPAWYFWCRGSGARPGHLWVSEDPRRQVTEGRPAVPHLTCISQFWAFRFIRLESSADSLGLRFVIRKLGKNNAGPLRSWENPVKLKNTCTLWETAVLEQQ